MKILSIKRKAYAMLVAAALLCAVLCAFLSREHKGNAIAEAADAPTYTTTDRLYLEIPSPSKSMTFKTIGGQVNGGTHSNTVSSVSDSLNVRDWLELYIARNDGGKWNVPTKDAIGGKWYFDSTKHAIKGSVGVWLDVKSDMPQNKLYTFLCNGEELWERRHNPHLIHPCDDGCSVPNVRVNVARSLSPVYDGNPYTDAKSMTLESPYPIGAGNGWTTTSSNTCNGTLGINPTHGAKRLATVNAGSGTCTVSFDHWIGAYTTPGALSAGPGQNANRAKAQRDTFTIAFSTAADNSAPALSSEDPVSNTSVAATWTDSSYSFATYSLNGVAQGEYTQDQKLSDEGMYVVTATDCVGNSSSLSLIVDKTAPRFASEFYDAAGKPVIKYTKASSYVLSFPAATANESAIEQTATYVYSYYDSEAKKIVKEPAAYYRNGERLTKEGRYEITVSDAAGNSSTCTVVIDRSPPTFTSTEFSKSAVYASYSASDAESPISATYTFATSGGTSAAKSYGSGMRLSAEGKYTVTATDRAGNSSSITLFVDKTAPSITRSFEYGSRDGMATFMYSAWESPVTATYSYIGASGTKTDVAYSSGQFLTDDGEYTVTATDKAGNSSSVKITVDRKAPTLTFSDGTTGTSQITRSSSSVAWTVEKYESPVAVTYSFSSADEAIAPSVSDAPYGSGSVFTAEGTYGFTATDAAGNVTHATVVIDKTPPTLEFAAESVVFERYTNKAFTARGDDSLSGVDKIELYENGKYAPYDYSPRSMNGAYLFRVTDKAGNVTSVTATVYRTDTFGNAAALRDAYKLNAWYVVTLPARIFTTPGKDAAGRYSFESYDAALAFAVAKEREFRVTTVQGGYMYVSVANEAVSQKYETESGMLAAVQKYAKGYVSARQTSSSSGNDKYYTETVSLTRNSPILPDYLLDLKSLPRMYARSSATWSLPNIAYISEMPYCVTARYLGDFAEESAQKEFEIARGMALKDIDGYRQGWYLITERDGAGNVERYLVYSDAELPTARVTAEHGDGTHEFVLDHDYTRNETLYFLSLSFDALLDNADPYITLKLEKGNTTKYFTQSDALPVLGSEEYTSGKYTVTIYDRSLNALTFDAYIAGNAPTMTHGSLSADRPECRISFASSDRYNVITSIALYKVEYDGSRTVLDVDGAGVAVNAATLSYTLTVGGKYGATVTDNYRRTVEIAPIFFLKGLPSGKLSGVKDGGRTNRNVSFTFSASDVCEIFTLHPNGERRPFTGYSVQTGATNTTYNVTAGEDTSHEYLVFLHASHDRSLFVEYTFEIDTVLPEFEITDGDGNTIEPDGATNKPFSIKWLETGVSVRYYTARGGSLSASRYNMNAVLSQGTLYYFTLRDDVGNELEFTVLLDNAVDYTIGGRYNSVDGVIYANAPISFTVNEPTAVFDVENADGYSIDNGGTLTRAGRYEITVTDNYRNTVTLVIVLDFTPPTLTLVGADNGGSVNNDVTVNADGADMLYLADRAGNKLRDVSSGETFSAAGNYILVASDYAGNTVTATFSIDLTVEYTLSVPNGAVTTSTVLLNTAEPLTMSGTKDGLALELETLRFSSPGTYELTLTDAIGNSVSCVFVIVPSRVRTLDVELPFGTSILSAAKDGAAFSLSGERLALDVSGAYAVTLDCGGEIFELMLEIDNTPPEVTITKDGKTVKLADVDKVDVVLVLTRDGEEISCAVGKSFDAPGHYVLTVTDALGNVSVVEWDIPFRLNTWAIVAIAVSAVVLVVAVVLIIRARRKPKLK